MTWITVHGHTETGPTRAQNEDMITVGRFLKNAGPVEIRFTHDDDYVYRYGWTAVIADGMGGHAAGALAARLALRTFDTQFYSGEKNGDAAMMAQAIQCAADRANNTILEVAGSNAEYAGMGCTLAGVALIGLESIVFHAGDSRVYRFRQGALRQMTEDDTVVSMAVRAGAMTPQEADNSDIRHVITNGLGSSAFTLHMSEPQALRAGDILMICSDGLHGVVDWDTLEKILESSDPLARRVENLVAEAVRNGGPDNISVILIEIGPVWEEQKQDG